MKVYFATPNNRDASDELLPQLGEYDCSLSRRDLL